MSQDALNAQQFGDYDLHYHQLDTGARRNSHVIEAYHPTEDEPVGRMQWHGVTHRIEKIDVSQAHGRQGLGTAMWNMGQQMRPAPKHSPDRTATGDAWARKVGGSLPRRVKY